MPDIHDLLRHDNRMILTQNGTPVTLYDPNGETYQVRGRVVRIDSVEDPQTGQMVYEPRLSVSVPLADFRDAGAPVPSRGWYIETTDTLGMTLRRYVIDARVDRTIGFVTMFGESYIDGGEG